MKIKRIKGTQLTIKPVVKITHSQSAKQSHNWQSIDSSYGITREVDDNPEAIKEGFATLERIVEKRLSRKMKQQRTLLEAMGEQ